MNSAKRVLTALALAGAAMTMTGTAHAADRPDPVGVVKAVKDDPIGFVNWKLELPIPSQYRAFAGPVIKSTVNGYKGKIAKILNKAIKE
ncbi:hypothetical protein AB0G83_08670 [Streptomyces klenkii]|uniref:hypothetical protein n=1 Tax=Streptomyces klenkii TaxID=1420899 RepID=UPI0011C4AB82|nr:hypothetical protein [Streptomyces klenkii]